MYVAPDRVFLGLGTNVGDRMQHLQHALRRISEIESVSIVKCSEVLETEAWGKKDQADFLNAAVELECLISAEKLFEELQRIENEMGRERTVKWGPRIIDIDILFFGDACISNERIIIPHPEIQNRKFVLANLCDIGPRLFHPVLKCTMMELWDDLKDDSRITKFGKLAW